MSVSQSTRRLNSAENQHGESEEHVIKSVDELQNLGMNMSDITKLHAANIGTVGMVLSTPAKHLENIKGFSEAKVQKLIDCCKKLQPSGFMSATEALDSRKCILKINSGATALNELLGGGFQSKSITEIHGEFRTGKSQLCHTLCVTTQMPRSEGGAEGKVVFIDTEGTFRPERLIEIATAYGFEPDQIVENVLFKRVMTHDEQMLAPQQIAALLTQQPPEPIKLVIIDSLMSLFRVEFSGRGELSIRQQLLGRHLHDLQRIADEFNIAVVVTNQMTADPGAMIAACSQKPVGGNIVAHACQTRIIMKKGRENSRIVKLIDSPEMPEGDAQIQLSAKGVEDN